MPVIDPDTLDICTRAAVLFSSVNSRMTSCLDLVEYRLRKYDPTVADRAAFGFAAVQTCYRTVRHELAAVVQTRDYDRVAAVLALGQDACRRAIWYTDLALEFIVDSREDHVEFRRRLQSTLDESFVVRPYVRP